MSQLQLKCKILIQKHAPNAQLDTNANFDVGYQNNAFGGVPNLTV